MKKKLIKNSIYFAVVFCTAISESFCSQNTEKSLEVLQAEFRTMCEQHHSPGRQFNNHMRSLSKGTSDIPAGGFFATYSATGVEERMKKDKEIADYLKNRDEQEKKHIAELTEKTKEIIVTALKQLQQKDKEIAGLQDALNKERQARAEAEGKYKGVQETARSVIGGGRSNVSAGGVSVSSMKDVKQKTEDDL